MSKNKILDSIFNQFLNEKLAMVHADGLHVQGITDGEVRLLYNKSQGLICQGKLLDNSIDVMNQIESVFQAKREAIRFSFDSIETITKLTHDILTNISVQHGTISPINVCNFETTTNEDGEISTLNILYNNGSRVTIKNIH